MSGIRPAPLYNPVVDDQGKPTIPWTIFFNSLYEGDSGTEWTPTFTSLTEVGGAATITGAYYRLWRRLCYFRVQIVPVTNTSAVAGTTYIDNFPLLFSNDGACWAMAGNTGTSAGHVVASNNRIYVPAWTTVTVPVTIIGIGEVG